MINLTIQYRLDNVSSDMISLDTLSIISNNILVIPSIKNNNFILVYDNDKRVTLNNFYLNTKYIDSIKEYKEVISDIANKVVSLVPTPGYGTTKLNELNLNLTH